MMQNKAQQKTQPERRTQNQTRGKTHKLKLKKQIATNPKYTL